METAIKFILQMPDGAAISEKTEIRLSNRNGFKIQTELEICEFIKREFCKINSCKSLTDWANQLNATGDFEGSFTKYDALDWIASNFNLNISGKYINIYEFYQKYNPFKK